MHKLTKYTIIILFGAILLTSLILPFAFAQRPTQQILEELKSRDKFNCEVWQINEFFHLPVRMNLIHEAVDDHQVSIKSTDPASEVFWEGSRTNFQMVTASPDRHTVEVILDYELKHQEPRQVYYQIYSQDNILMMEGNWQHEGFTFCKVIEMSTSEAPHILTAEEIQEENNKFNADFRAENAEKFTSLENAQITYGILLLIIGIIISVFLIIAVMMYSKSAKVANKPLKKLDEMINIHRNLNKNLELITERMTDIMGEMKRDVSNKIDSKIGDLMIVIEATKKAVEDTLPSEPNHKPLKDQITTSDVVMKTEEAKSVAKKVTNSFVKIIKPKKVTEPEPTGFDNEEEILELLHQDNEKNITTKPDTTQPDTTPIPETKIIPESEIEEHKHLEMDTSEPDDLGLDNLDEIETDVLPECDTCGDVTDDMLLCPLCEKAFCERDYKSHKCIDESKFEEKVDKKELAKKTFSTVKAQFFDEKKLKETDDESIQKALDSGVTPEAVSKLLADEWMKNSREKNEDIYKKFRINYTDEPTVLLALKMNAMITVLQRQVRN